MEETKLNLVISVTKDVNKDEIKSEIAEAIADFSVALEKLSDKYQIDLYPTLEVQGISLKK